MAPEVEQTYGYLLGTVQGETRDVVVTRERICDDTGKIIDAQGFYIYPTPTDRARQAATSEAVTEIREPPMAAHQRIRATGTSRDAW